MNKQNLNILHWVKFLINEDDKKEGLFKRLKSIKDKNEELLDAFSGANKASKAAKINVNNNKKKICL